jgi:hypothetical protein
MTDSLTLHLHSRSVLSKETRQIAPQKKNWPMKLSAAAVVAVVLLIVLASGMCTRVSCILQVRTSS